jgi:hypothetical protein
MMMDPISAEFVSDAYNSLKAAHGTPPTAYQIADLYCELQCDEETTRANYDKMVAATTEEVRYYMA